MSKTSAQQRYKQTMSWLSTFKKSTAKTDKPKHESRMDHYKKQGGR